MKNTRGISGKRIFFIIIGLVVLVFAARHLWLYYARTVVEQGKIAYDQRDYDLAISSYTRANKLIFDKEQRASNLLWRGRAYYYGKDDFDMAIADFTKAIELHPNYVAYYLWRGRAYQQKMEYDSAIADFTKAIELDSDYDNFIERGDVYVDKGDYALAILDYNQAIAGIDAAIARRLEWNEDNKDLYQRRDEVVAQRNYVERLNNPVTTDDNNPRKSARDILSEMVKEYLENKTKEQ